MRLPPHDDFPGFLGFPISVANFLVLGFWQNPHGWCDVIAGRRPCARPTIKSPRTSAMPSSSNMRSTSPMRSVTITDNDYDMGRQSKFSRGGSINLTTLSIETDLHCTRRIARLVGQPCEFFRTVVTSARALAPRGMGGHARRCRCRCVCQSRTTN